MEASLIGCLVLIAEDEPLIAFEIKQGFEEEGAKVIIARTLTETLLGIEDAALSVAILDHGLGDDDSREVRERMKEPISLNLCSPGIRASMSSQRSMPQNSVPGPSAVFRTMRILPVPVPRSRTRCGCVGRARRAR
jgi:CheY-like chemotaxis protein